MSAVFDANVVVKWFVEDPLSDATLEALADLGPAIAPSILTVEVANTLRRYVVKGDLEVDLARDAIAETVRRVRLLDHRSYLEEAVILACRYNHSVQDCIYVVMALRETLPLVTADARLARKLNDLAGLDLRLIAPSETNDA